MRTKPRPFYTPWKARPEFEPTTFTNDFKRLRIFYQAHGYYHLRLTYDLTTTVERKERIWSTSNCIWSRGSRSGSPIST